MIAWLSRRLSVLGVEFTVGEALAVVLLAPCAAVCGWLFVVTYVALLSPLA